MAVPPAKRSRIEGTRPLDLILPTHFKDVVREYLRQDMPSFDIGAYVVGDAPCTAKLLAKTDGILSGVPFFNAVFEELGCTVEWLLQEGDTVGPKKVAESQRAPAAKADASKDGSYDSTDNHFKGRHHVATVSGPVHRLLQGERTALNILSRSSGIATETRALVDVKLRKGWHGEIAATRKVTPGFRLVEKYSAIVGGGVPHRMNLSDMTMLKDNHVWACGGSIKAMVEKTRGVCGFSNKIEVECQSVEEAFEAAGAGAEVVMLDNFPPEEAKAAARKLKERFPHGLTIEVSGGMTPEDFVDYFSEDVDVISFGKLTHGYGVLDFSLKISR
mmetsp:Transcript_58535/g.171248  ORF Transcript_58535/g.171248 Transcript_58535/m.171248 type:complete len:331 (+) Transcript_58535:51-1043(+)